MSVEATTAPKTDNGSLAGQFRKAMGGNVRQYGMIIALLLLVGLFQVLTDGLFLQPRNVTSLLVQNGYVLILAILGPLLTRQSNAVSRGLYRVLSRLPGRSRKED